MVTLLLLDCSIIYLNFVHQNISLVMELHCIQNTIIHNTKIYKSLHEVNVFRMQNVLSSIGWSKFIQLSMYSMSKTKLYHISFNWEAQNPELLVSQIKTIITVLFSCYLKINNNWKLFYFSFLFKDLFNKIDWKHDIKSIVRRGK